MDGTRLCVDPSPGAWGGARAPALRLTDVSVRTPDGRTILTADRLELAPGSTLGVRGPSGAGKSTLLHVLAGLIVPERGVVVWGSTDVAALGSRERDAFRRTTFGLVFQDFLLFEELSALDNAAVAANFLPAVERGAVRRRAAALLERLGVAADARDVASFSGGERQRVAVARALACDPPVVLADEPTASLDRANADRLVADLLALARDDGRTVVAVSHDPAVMAAMDRVVDVVDGRLEM